jgi:hypothetical protein
MPGTKKSPALTAPRGSNWLKEGAKRAVSAAAEETAQTGPRDAITVAEVVNGSKELGRTTQRKRLRDKIDDVVAGAAAQNSAHIATARAKRDQ